MPTYEVKLLQDQVLEQWVRIEADSPKQAEKLAWDGEGDLVGEAKWQSGSIIDVLETRKVETGP